jgi:hypothetical protein
MTLLGAQLRGLERNLAEAAPLELTLLDCWLHISVIALQTSAFSGCSALYITQEFLCNECSGLTL